ncbi:Tol-Pal system protein TolQ [Afipia felis]
MKLSLNTPYMMGSRRRLWAADAAIVLLVTLLSFSIAPQLAYAGAQANSDAPALTAASRSTAPRVAQAASPATQPEQLPPSSALPGAPSGDNASAPAPQTPPTTEVIESIDSSPILPHELTPIGMFMAADYIVKSVMIGLALASILTWSVWLAKTLELLGARRKLIRDLDSVEKAYSLDEAGKILQQSDSDIATLTNAARNEIRRSHDAINHEGVKERVASLFSRIEAAASRRMTRGTSILATIGSTAPFVGLFGTVWGIMNSFIGISKSQTTNLAVVAPGIAEALLATAMGLVAAIPAVMIYNMFSRAITGYRGLLGDGSAELMRMVSRDLNRSEMIPHQRAAE